MNNDNPIFGDPVPIAHNRGCAPNSSGHPMPLVADVADESRAGLRGARSGLTRGGVR